MPTIDLNGVPIAYTDTGPPPGAPDAPTIVFGHGLLFSGWMFAAQVAALQRSYRCVTVDWRGQGDTPATDGGYDMDTLTGDAVALIRALGVAPVHWVGLSMGGFMGLRLAARHGDLLRSLTLLDTSAGPEDPRKIRQYRLMALLYQVVGIRPLMPRVQPIMFGPTFLADPTNRAVIDSWAVRLNRCDRAGVRQAILAVCHRRPVADELSRITVPTLIAVGADDVATPPAQANRMAAGIRGATVVPIAECGHSSSVEQSAVVTDLLATFLTSVDAPRRP